MGNPSRPVAQGPFNIASTSTGLLGLGSTAGAKVAYFGTGMSAATLYYKNPGSTLNIAVKMQGTIGNSAVWSDLCAATTLSTGASGGVINSTATLTFDAVRIACTANAFNSTNTGNVNAWLLAR